MARRDRLTLRWLRQLYPYASDQNTALPPTQLQSQAPSPLTFAPRRNIVRFRVTAPFLSPQNRLAINSGQGNYQAITGVARITVVTSQTIPGKARITATTSQTITGIARIQITSSQTITGKARITVTTGQTITGVARITATTTKTITGKARIQTTDTQTITGVARIQITTPKTITGISRITATQPRTVTGVSRIQTIQPRTITGVARITVTQQQTITGVANIQPGPPVFHPFKSTILDLDMAYLGTTLGATGDTIPISVVTSAPSGAPPNDVGLQFQVSGGVVTIWVWDGTTWRSF